MNYINCINFACIKHKNQRRKDPESTPYINHPVGVAHILSYECNIHEEDILLAAILHDTVEDTDTTFEELEKEFGVTVTNIVREVTDDKTLDKAERKNLQILNARKSSREAKFVKLADKLYNLRDLLRCTPNGWSQQRVDEYFEWAYKVVENLRGTNIILEQKLDAVFQEHESRQKNKTD